MKSATRASVRIVLLGIALATSAWAQWSSDPSQNLALSNIPGADQVQPKLLPLPNNSWYVSWFNNNPNDPPPQGYDVYYQLLNANGVEQFPHDGVQVARLTLSSTEDYGLAIDGQGNALLAFLDDRVYPDNPQVTAAKMNASGQPLWGPNGVALTHDPGSHFAPKITVTSDGYVVVAWSTDNGVVLQKLTPDGKPVWIGTNAFQYGITLQESGYTYLLADLHAADNGSVIVSWVRNHGFGSNNYLYANKISPTGQLMWGSGHVHVFDGGSLQFGEFPYFTPDGSGGAVFSWYSNSPSLQVYAQHILADGTEAFGHNGSVGSLNSSRVRVSPSVSWNPSTQETFLFWTEQNSLQSEAGVWGQKFNSAGVRQWTDTGLTIVPLGPDSEIWVENVQIGTGALVFWVDSPGFGQGTIQAIKLDGNGGAVCAQFPVSTASADKSRLAAGLASSGLAALTWEDDRNGENDIFIQNVNPDCTLGIEDALMVRK
ncbi:MAG TPA: hypothetical protein VL240_13700 [Candidatus Binatia bacterium]|nr:hypothetical protein [Candidatus Binatia bacterium]